MKMLLIRRLILGLSLSAYAIGFAIELKLGNDNNDDETLHIFNCSNEQIKQSHTDLTDEENIPDEKPCLPFENLWKNWTYHGPQGNKPSWEASLAAKKVPQVVAIALGYIEYLSALYHFNYSRKDAQNKQKHLSPGEKINVQQMQGNMQGASPVVQQRVAYFEYNFIKTSFFSKKWEQIKVITEDENFPEYGVAYYEDSVNKQAGYGQIIVKSNLLTCEDGEFPIDESYVLEITNTIASAYETHGRIPKGIRDGAVELPLVGQRCKFLIATVYLPPEAKKEDLSGSHASLVASILTGLQSYMLNHDDMRYTSLAYQAGMDFFLFPQPRAGIYDRSFKKCGFTNLLPKNIVQYDVLASSSTYLERFLDGTQKTDCLDKFTVGRRDVVVASSNWIDDMQKLLEMDELDEHLPIDETKKTLQEACFSFGLHVGDGEAHKLQNFIGGIDHHYYTVASGYSLKVNPFKIQLRLKQDYEDMLNEFGNRLRTAMPVWGSESWLSECFDYYKQSTSPKPEKDLLLSNFSASLETYGDYTMKVPDMPYKVITTAHTTTSRAGTSLAQPVFSSILLAIKAFLKMPNRREILLANFTNMLFFNAQQGIDIKSEHKLNRDSEEYLNIIEQLMGSVIGGVDHTYRHYDVKAFKKDLADMDAMLAIKDEVNLTRNTKTEYKYGHFMTDASFFAPIAMMCLYDKEWSEHLGLLAKYCNKLTKYNTFRVEQPKLKY